MPSAGRSAASTILTAALRSGTTVHGKNSSTTRSPYCEAKSLIAASRSVNRLRSGSYAEVIMYLAPSSAGRHEGLERGDVDLRRNPDELDIEHAHAGR